MPMVTPRWLRTLANMPMQGAKLLGSVPNGRHSEGQSTLSLKENARNLCLSLGLLFLIHFKSRNGCNTYRKTYYLKKV